MRVWVPSGDAPASAEGWDEGGPRVQLPDSSGLGFAGRKHEAGEKAIHGFRVVDRSDPAHVLVWAQDHGAAGLRVDAVVCVRLAVALVVGFVVCEDFPVVPTERVGEWVEDVWEIEQFDARSRPGVDGEYLDD